MNDDEIPARFRGLLGAIVSGGTAAPTPRALAVALNMAPPVLADLVADAAERDLVEIWQSAPGGLGVTLTTWSAARLRVEICGRTGGWVRRGKGRHETTPPWASWVVLESDLAGPDGVRPDLDDTAADPREDADERVPSPRLILGANWVGWPPPPRAKGCPCPVCGDRPSPIAVCLECSRSGVDHLIRRPRAGRKPIASVVKFQPRTRGARKAAGRP